MLNILVVEDEVEKRSALCEAIRDFDPNLLKRTDCVVDVNEAKRSLKKKKYDLLVLDINLPGRIDDRARVGAGLDVLSFLRDNDSAVSPAAIIGITAYKDGAELAMRERGVPFWKLVHFSYEDRSWRDDIHEALKYLSKSKTPPFFNDGHTFYFDLGIVVALEAELKPYFDLPVRWNEVRVAHDSNRYWVGKFESQGKELSVVATVAQQMGMTSSAISSIQLIHAFRPKYIAMSGICAGVKEKVQMGDLLVADPVFDWGSGKWKEVGEDRKLEFLPAPYQWRLDTGLRADINAVAEIPGLLEEIRKNYHGRRPDAAPKLIIEAMASGGSVLQASMLMGEVRDQHKNVVGVDMEIYAVFSAASYASQPRPTCFSIKSVCDFGDGEKNDNFHEYAAYCSANFLYRFALEKIAIADD